jgi:VCBS repeat protein
LRRALARGAVALLLLGGWSCARLPEVAAGECGNGVVEALEDCDSFDAENGASCRPRGSVGECHLDCNLGADGSRGQCPSGWGCDLAGICRRPSGQFETLPELELGSAASLLSGDFDGDGRADVASLETPGPTGITYFQLHYFDEQARVSETRAFPKSVLSPIVTDLSKDGRSDVLFSDFRLGVLLGRGDRSWVPETFSSYRILDTSILTASVFAGNVQGTSGFIVFAAFEGVSGLYVPDTANGGVPRLLGTLEAPNEALVGHPVSGRVIEDTALAPCLQIALALRGQSHFSLIDACARDVFGTPVWRDQVQQWTVELDPPEPISGAPLLVDLDLDGHLDVLIGTDARAYIARGDGQGLSTAVPYRPPVANLETDAAEMPLPLAAGDLTGDGAPDFIFSDRILLSAPTADPTLFEYTAGTAAPGYWSAAQIADLNGNGKLDAVAASSARPGIDFFNGTGTIDLIGFRLPSSRPVDALVVGDFDGDLLNDLAFTESGSASGQSSIMLAFGATSGPPRTPTPVARLNDIEQMTVYREGGFSHLIVTSNESVGDRENGALTFLVGSTDRIPTALYELTSFGTNNSTNGSVAVHVQSGDFSAPDSGDVLALAFDEQLTDELEFWLLPALLHSVGTPVHLQGTLSPELHPVLGTPLGARLRLASAVADLDGDRRAELLLAMPAQDDEQCELVLLGVDGAQMVTRSSLHLAQPCTTASITPVDVDGDDWTDIVLLGGRVDTTGAQLSVFWNDGAGAFSSERRTLLSDPADSPQAFSVIAPTPTRGFSFVYAAAQALQQVSISDGARALGPVSTLAEVGGCTGLVAADLNGDGATDLGLARQGNLSVMKAILESL